MTAILAAAFLLSQILCQLLVTVDCVGELPTGYVRYPEDNKKAIKIHSETLTWNEARERCVSESADLAVATSYTKIRHIQNRSESGDVWLGIHRPLGKGTALVRVDTGALVEDDAPWAFIPDGEDDNCAATLYNGSITDYDCTYMFEFACEISLADG